MDQPIVRFVRQSESVNGDCTVASLGMLLGLTYSEALVLIARVNPDVLSKGSTWAQLRKAAKLRSVVLEERRGFSLDDDSSDSGILGIHMPNGKQHAVYLKRGLIFDGASEQVWDADVYLQVHNAEAVSLLTRKELK